MSSIPPVISPTSSTILNIEPNLSLWQWIDSEAERLKFSFRNVRCLLLERFEPKTLKVWRFSSTLEAMRTKEVFVKYRGKDLSNVIILSFELNGTNETALGSLGS
ncbi:MAG TPA: hypothetical protein VJ044_13960, partial [Candidatus Hodarchaeales archaeon]|nr:hypothetical protein [Candidatus Hodarchaeales archaeon]